MSNTKQNLQKDGNQYKFFQAVRLIENAFPNRPKLGKNGPPGQEPVQLRPSKSMSFPPGDVHKIERLPDDEDGQEKWRITENFMGLYGVSSPLPPYFSDMIIQADIEPDPLRNFLDLFNHRMISLFYRAWEKYRFQSGGEADAEDTLAEALKAIVGEDSKNDDFWKIPAGELTVYAGVLAGGNRSPALLEGVVSDYFGIENVKVTQFFPKRIKLSGRQRTKIGFNGQNNQLGKDIVIGGSMLDHSGWFKLSLGPLKQQVFDAFLPGREGYKKLVFLVNLFTRQQLHFELELILEACEVQGTWASAQNNHQRLGRTTWLGKPESKTVSIKLTA